MSSLPILQAGSFVRTTGVIGQERYAIENTQGEAKIEVSFEYPEAPVKR
jgi:hypothetical protein